MSQPDPLQTTRPPIAETHQLSTDTRVSRPLVPLALAVVTGAALGTLADAFPLGATAIGIGLAGFQHLVRRSLPRFLAFGPRDRKSVCRERV